jgi:hypothetical protein
MRSNDGCCGGVKLVQLIAVNANLQCKGWIRQSAICESDCFGVTSFCRSFWLAAVGP